MTMLLRASLALAAALLLLAVAGCGEKDEPETTGPVVPATDATSPIDASTTETTTAATLPEQLIRSAISSFLTAGDPVVCEQALTAHFVRSAYGDLKGCEAAQRPASAAKSIEITALRVDGSNATATVVPRGGTSDGERLKVALVGEGDSFLIDSLESNAPVGP